MERKSSRVVVLVLTGHALATAWTWRDIRQQPAQQVRGSKTFWRIFSAVNTLGSVRVMLAGKASQGLPGSSSSLADCYGAWVAGHLETATSGWRPRRPPLRVHAGVHSLRACHASSA